MSFISAITSAFEQPWLRPLPEGEETIKMTDCIVYDCVCTNREYLNVIIRRLHDHQHSYVTLHFYGDCVPKKMFWQIAIWFDHLTLH